MHSPATNFALYSEEDKLLGKNTKHRALLCSGITYGENTSFANHLAITMENIPEFRM